MKLKINLLLLILPVLAFVSCKDDAIDLAKSILTSDSIATKVDTFRINALTNSVVSIPAKNTNDTYLLGKHKDNVFGVTIGEILAQFNCPSSWTLPTNTLTTQLVLKVSYYGSNASFGDSVTISAYPMNKQTFTIPSGSSSSYSSNIDPTEYSTDTKALGSSKLAISSIHSDSVVTVPIVLSDSLKNVLIEASKNDPSLFSSESKFVTELFHGMYIKAESSKNSMLTVTALNMYLDYTYNNAGGTTIKESKIFPANKEVRQVNHIVHDYTGCLPVNDSVVYLNSPAGKYVSVFMPLKRMRDSLGIKSVNGVAYLGSKKLSVNNGFLKVEISDTTSTSLRPSTYAVLIKKSSLESFFTNSDLPDKITAMEGTYSTTTMAYSFDLKYYLANEFKAETVPENDELVIVPITISVNSSGTTTAVEYDTTLHGAILKAMKNPSPLKLDLFVSGF